MYPAFGKAVKPSSARPEIGAVAGGEILVILMRMAGVRGVKYLVPVRGGHPHAHGEIGGYGFWQQAICNHPHVRG